MFLFLCILMLNVIPSLSDLVTGECPTLTTSDELEDITYYTNCSTVATRSEIYAFLPASRDYERFSPFSFDLKNLDNGFSRKDIEIGCSIMGKGNYEGRMLEIKFFNGVRGVQSIFSNGTLNFKKRPRMFIFTLELDGFKLGMNQVREELCKSFFTSKNYRYDFKVKRGEYFLLWGCVQINDTTFDRGLILIGDGNAKDPVEVFDQMLLDTGLKDSEKTLKNHVLFRRNTPLNNNNTLYNPLYFSDCKIRPKPYEDKTVKFWIMGILGILTIIVLIVAYLVIG